MIFVQILCKSDGIFLHKQYGTRKCCIGRKKHETLENTISLPCYMPPSMACSRILYDFKIYNVSKWMWEWFVILYACHPRNKQKNCTCRDAEATRTIYLFKEAIAWFSVAVGFACQKIRTDNLALVTLHYCKQWNTQDSCVTPLWGEHKGHASKQYRLKYHNWHLCHRALQGPIGGSAWEIWWKTRVHKHLF